MAFFAAILPFLGKAAAAAGPALKTAAVAAGTAAATGAVSSLFGGGAAPISKSTGVNLGSISASSRARTSQTSGMASRTGIVQKAEVPTIDFSSIFNTPALRFAQTMDTDFQSVLDTAFSSKKLRQTDIGNFLANRLRGA